MAVKALIFGTDDLFPHLKPFYENQVKEGNIEIVGYGYIENDKLKTYSDNNPGGGGLILT